jgi:hypothetical protein
MVTSINHETRPGLSEIYTRDDEFQVKTAEAQMDQGNWRIRTRTGGLEAIHAKTQH